MISGHLLDDAIVRRSDKFIRELIWMAKCLRHGREETTIDEEAAEVAASMPCPGCGASMNHHADKSFPDSQPESANSPVHAILACASCGLTTATPDPSVGVVEMTA